MDINDPHATLFELAADLFEGDAEVARAWAIAPNKALGGITPLRVAETEGGLLEMEGLIGRLEHGVFM